MERGNLVTTKLWFLVSYFFYLFASFFNLQILDISVPASSKFTITYLHTNILTLALHVCASVTLKLTVLLHVQTENSYMNPSAHSCSLIGHHVSVVPHTK